MHTFADFIRIVAAVAAGCGLYDACMYTIARLHHKRMTKAMVAQVDAMRARYEELVKTQEANKKA